MTMSQDDAKNAKRVNSLIAIGAAAAVNCRPCLEYHVPHGLENGLTEEEIRGAIEVGFAVNKGAHAKTCGYIDDVIAESAHADPGQSCCNPTLAEETGCC